MSAGTLVWILFVVVILSAGAASRRPR